MYGAGRYTYTRQQIGTRYMLAGMRTFVNPSDPKDIAAVHALRDKDAMYVTVVPAKNDGKTIHRVTVKDVTVDAFCSISVYNAKGSSSRTRSTHTFNNVTGTKAADGSITVQFGGCDAKTPNCLPISPGWNYWVRLYRPRPEILNGKWTFPAAEPCGERRPTSRPHRRWPLSSSLRRSHRPLAKPLPRAQANLPGIS